MSEAYKIIEQELANYRGAKKNTETNVFICCPFHGERTPSLGIYTVERGKLPYGSFHCFGCGTKGTWNKLAKELNLRQVSEEDLIEDTAYTNKRELEKRRNRLLANKDEVELPYSVEFKDQEWRGIKGDLLRALGCRLAYNNKERISELIIPIMVKQKLLTFIKARIKKKKGRVSYILDDAKGVKEFGLFPYDYVRSLIKSTRPRGLVLVEGPRDALSLIQNGIPALAILGTNMFGQEKAKTLEYLCNRYDLTLYLCMDADKAKTNGIKPGQKAQAHIYRTMKGRVEVKKINLESIAKTLGLEELDPATLPRKYIRRIKKLI